MKQLRLALNLTILLTMIAAALIVWGLSYGNETPRLVCSINSEVVFDQPFDAISKTQDGYFLTLDGRSEELVVPEGMTCH